MSGQSGYLEYKEHLMNELRTDALIEGTDPDDKFLDWALSSLDGFGEVQGIEKTGLGDKPVSRQRLMRIDGYGFDETDRSLELFISDYQDTDDAENMTQGRVDELYWRMYYFLDEACNGSMERYFDDSDEILKIAKLVKYRVKNASDDDPEQALKIRMFILTNKEMSNDLLGQNLLETKIRKAKGKGTSVKSTKKIKKEDFCGKPLELDIWYLERFYEREQELSNDPVVIDFRKDYQCDGLPCLKGNIGEDTGYDAYMAIIPGKVLANIYIDHGSRVLEGNVRAFLGTGGSKSVNRGIMHTINNEPSKFFTYNNGIAATAADVEIDEKDGQAFISKIVDLQIINGGQTTASLAEAVMKKTNPRLEGIYVSMKLTVIEDREAENADGVRFYDEMVQSIAKYANSQNKVTAADLFSNDPFHIAMERLSKKVLAPAVHYPVPTGWYYERARKKYKQELQRSGNKKKFEMKFPSNQVITKEELAKYVTAVRCQPYVVAKGKDYTIRQFNKIVVEDYKKDRGAFNEFYFKKCVCAAIIYKSIDNYLVEHQETARRKTGFWYKAGGYKLDIVPYTVAKIVSAIPAGRSLDWLAIWKNQRISANFMREVEIVTKMTNDFICDSGNTIVTQYCKKEETWEKYKAMPYKLSPAFADELVPLSLIAEQEKTESKGEREKEDLTLAVDIVRLGAGFWESLLRQGKEKGRLGYTDETYLKLAAQWAKAGKAPERRDMSKVRKIYEIKSNLESMGIKGETESGIQPSPSSDID